MLGTENGDEGIFLEKTNSAGTIKIGDNTSAAVQTYCQTNSDVQAIITNTSVLAKFEASTASDKYARGTANANGGYFEALAGTKQILLSANTLSANQSLTLKNWGSVTAPIYVASTDVVDLSSLTGICALSYDNSRLKIGNTTCPVETTQMLGVENGSNGVFLSKKSTSSEIVIQDPTLAFTQARKNDYIYAKMASSQSDTTCYVVTIYNDFKTWMHTYPDFSSFGGAYKNTEDNFKAQGYADAVLSTLEAKYGNIKSILYTTTTSTSITSEYSSNIKARMGANQNYSDFYITSSTNNIRLKADANSALILENIAYNGTGPASKSINLSIADITPASAIIKLREFSICVNGETKKCMILASDYY